MADNRLSHALVLCKNTLFVGFDFEMQVQFVRDFFRYWEAVSLYIRSPGCDTDSNCKSAAP